MTNQTKYQDDLDISIYDNSGHGSAIMVRITKEYITADAKIVKQELFYEDPAQSASDSSSYWEERYWEQRLANLID